VSIDLLKTYESKEAAWEACTEYAAWLKRMKCTDEFGVFVRRCKGEYGVWIRDRRQDG
jgi:hypothetical protein